MRHAGALTQNVARREARPTRAFDRLGAAGLDPSPKLRTLWFIEFDYRSGMRHGATLRFINYAKELTAKGHDVYFVVRRRRTDSAVEKRAALAKLVEERVIAGYYEFEYSFPRLRGKAVHAVCYPAIENRVLAEYQQETKSFVDRIVNDKGINLCIFSDRSVLFLLPSLGERVVTIVDWMDSAVLYRSREIWLHLKQGQLWQAAKPVRSLVNSLLEERYYGKFAGANVVVSQVDKKCLDTFNNARHKNKVLLNGVNAEGAPEQVTKIKDRLIFSGNMDFAPNYQAALWFIEHVLPIILERKRDVQ